MKPRTCTLLLFTLMLNACVYYPRQVEVYDPDCQIVSRKLVLEGGDAGFVHFSCTNEGCLLPLIPAAASAIISGSIVIAGNAIYWLEKRGRCQRTDGD